MTRNCGDGIIVFMSGQEKYQWKVNERCRLDVFLREKIPLVLDTCENQENALSNSKIRRFIFAGQVRVNSLLCRNPAFELKKNDAVTVFIDRRKIMYEKKPLDADFILSENDVIYEDDYIIAVNKPPFVPTEDTIVKDRISMHKCVVDYLWKKNPSLRNPPYAGVAHRLDRETSGVLLMTKTRSVNKDIFDVFAGHDLVKEYRAVCTEMPLANRKIKSYSPQTVQHKKGNSFTVEFPMGRISAKSSRCMMGPLSKEKGGVDSKTEFFIAEERDGFFYIDCRLFTGRTHQIRLHLSSCGLPVAGDTFYGGVRGLSEFGGRIMLHAQKLSFIHPVTKQLLSLKAPLPAGFGQSSKEPVFNSSATLSQLS